MNKTLKAGLIERIKREIDPSLLIVPQTTPVVFFGDYDNAKACTISLNPSDREFISERWDNETSIEDFVDDKILKAENAGLCSRSELGIDKEDHRKLRCGEAEKVLKYCINYFNKKPYKRWFNPFNEFIESFSNNKYSYYGGTCIHLDLVQWATYKKWDDLSDYVKCKLLHKDLDILKLILDSKNFEMIFLNGRRTVENIRDYLNVNLEEKKDTFENTKEEKQEFIVFHGKYNSSKTNIVGWNWNLQSSRAVSGKKNRMSMCEKTKNIISQMEAQNETQQPA